MASLTFDLEPNAEPSMVTGTLEPRLELDGLVVSGPAKDGHRGRSLRIAVSAVLHGAVALALVVVPLLRSTEMPEPAQGVHVFFAAPALVPPPPPPPPPAAATRAAVVAKVAPQADSHRFVAPLDLPSNLAPSDGLDLGVEGGVAGGVEGGVAGGVVGGVVGGLVDVAPAVRPVRVGGEVAEPRKLKHVDPVYPFIARNAAIQGVVVIECTIGIDGRVEGASVMKGVPLLNDAALAAVRQWRYTPTLYQGVPVPAIMTVKVSFSLARPLPS